jgi:tetratricopeptide (TPR) repeat protein
VLQASAAALGGGYRQYGTILNMAENRARLHDGAALAWLADQPRPASLPIGTRRGVYAVPLRMHASLQHWPQVIAQVAELEKAMPQLEFSQMGREHWSNVLVGPRLALAKAKTGDLAAAERLIATTPADCHDCIRARGQIASEAKQWARADFWFARAVADAPSIPFAHEEWGRSLLARGKPDEAVAQFTLANTKGPKFADALEGWGEALMAQNQSHLALAKFQQAAQYAPNWGRLYLKWGQSLAYAGKPDDAKAKFAHAATLDLTPSEKAELAGMRP